MRLPASASPSHRRASAAVALGIACVLGAGLAGCAPEPDTGRAPAPDATSTAPQSARPSEPAPEAPAEPEFDRTAHSVDDPASIWVVSNKARPLSPVDFAPGDLVLPEGIENEFTQPLR